MKKIITISLVLLTISCHEKERIPDYVMSEERFIEVLTEFQLAESMVRLGYHRTPDSLYLNDSVYMGVFHELGINQELFDSNYAYYSKDPDKFGKIYDQVIVNLSERSAHLIEKKNLEED